MTSGHGRPSSTTGPDSSGCTPRPAATTATGSPRTGPAASCAPRSRAPASCSPATPTNRPTGASGAFGPWNAGSIGNPVTDDFRAGYVIVYADRQGHRLDPRRVQHEDAFLRRVRDSGHPAHDDIASFQDGRQVRYAARRPGAPRVST